MNDKIDLKSQRVKSYFLEAAKQIISSNGVEGISARKVAENAGYSYATIYNYFKDIDELLGETKALMVTDVMKYMQENMNFTPTCTEDLLRLFAAYVKYYLDHPNIFRFFYSYRLSDAEALKEHYDFNTALNSSFRFLIDEGYIQETSAEDCAKSIIYAVHGLLALYFSGNSLTKEILFADLEKIIRFMLRCEK